MANTARALNFERLAAPASKLLSLVSEPKFQPLSVPYLHPLFPQGLARGGITEINGRRSSGRTSLALQVLAEATRRGEVCAAIDLYNCFDPRSAADAGVQLDRLIWVRCNGNPEYAMRAADLVLHAGGFGIVLLDLCEANARILNRIPLSYWYRFRRAIESTSTILLICADSPQAKCSSNQVCVEQKRAWWSGQFPFLLLEKLEVKASLRTAALPAQSLFLRTVA